MRSVPEWIGKTDDDPVPNRVKRRVFVRDNWTCQGCKRQLRDGDRIACDHAIAIINDGPNREKNLWTLCGWCHDEKTKDDVAQKSKTYHSHLKRAGIREQKWPTFQTNKDGPFKKTIRHGTHRR